ncbi:unnamed protein product [Mycena citricolor]|uniref:Mitochondrial glyco protein n=1 Tax=Mycena citricolor TaxID=2018698 RepID=A0AAD2K2T8_9AGAR|nr:unnamed protein product [Mycena citricolor]
MSSLRALRQLSSISRTVSLRGKHSPPLHLLAATGRALPSTTLRAFSVSTPTRSATPASTALLEKLKEELDYEVKAASDSGEQLPEVLSAFLSEGVWKLEDVPGNDEVLLFGKYENETIRVMFSIADLQTVDESPENEMEEEEEEPETPTELRVRVTFSKSNAPGAMTADFYCSNGVLQPANVSYYADSETGTGLTMDADFTRRLLYNGPVFETLDAGLQEQFDAFFRERGIDEALGVFIPEYAQWKEQREYIAWLEGVHKFVGA